MTCSGWRFALFPSAGKFEVAGILLLVPCLTDGEGVMYGLWTWRNEQLRTQDNESVDKANNDRGRGSRAMCVSSASKALTLGFVMVQEPSGEAYLGDDATCELQQRLPQADYYTLTLLTCRLWAAARELSCCLLSKSSYTPCCSCSVFVFAIGRFFAGQADGPVCPDVVCACVYAETVHVPAPSIHPLHSMLGGSLT